MVQLLHNHIMTAPQPISPLVPALRFPQFANADVWQVVRLGEVCESVASGRNKTKLLEGAFPVFGSTGIIGYTNDPVYDYCSIIVARVGANAGMINIATGRYDVSDNAIIIQLKDVNLFFVYYYLTITNLNKIAFGSGQPLITATQLKQLPLPLPTLPEQQKIASCLSSLEEYISLTKKKLDLLKLHKKGLLQNLFPKNGETKPKFRFPGFEDEWKVVKLGEVCVEMTKKCDKNALDKLTYISTENMLQDFSGVKEIFKLPESGSFTKYQKDDLLISNIRPYLKKIWKAQFEGACSNDVIVFRVGNDYNVDFVQYIVKNDAFVEYCMKSVKGVNMPRGDKQEMKKYVLSLPSLAEQGQIASCLSSIDNKIAKYGEKLKALEVHKKGLMQKLFPKIN